MAISRDAAKDSGAGATSVTSVTIPTPSGGYGSGKLLIAACICGLNPSVLSIDNGFTIRKTVDQFSVCGLAVASKDNSSGAEASIKWTSSSSTDLFAIALQYSGALTAASLDKAPAGTNSGGSGVTTLAGPATGALSQANELVSTFLGVVGNLAAPTCAGGGAVILTQSSRLVAIEQIVSAITSVTHTPSWTNANFADAITLTFKASAAGVEVDSGFWTP